MINNINFKNNLIFSDSVLQLISNSNKILRELTGNRESLSTHSFKSKESIRDKERPSCTPLDSHCGICWYRRTPRQPKSVPRPPSSSFPLPNRRGKCLPHSQRPWHNRMRLALERAEDHCIPSPAPSQMSLSQIVDKAPRIHSTGSHYQSLFQLHERRAGQFPD